MSHLGEKIKGGGPLFFTIREYFFALQSLSEKKASLDCTLCTFGKFFPTYSRSPGWNSKTAKYGTEPAGPGKSCSSYETGRKTRSLHSETQLNSSGLQLPAQNGFRNPLRKDQSDPRFSRFHLPKPKRNRERRSSIRRTHGTQIEVLFRTKVF